MSHMHTPDNTDSFEILKPTVQKRNSEFLVLFLMFVEVGTRSTLGISQVNPMQAALNWIAMWTNIRFFM